MTEEDLINSVFSDHARRAAERSLGKDHMERDRAVELAERLSEMRERLFAEAELHPGMLVQWKPGLQNRRFPAYGEPVIVMDVIAPPIYDSKQDSFSPSYREPITMAGLVRAPGGDFEVYHFDGRRFEEWKP